MPHQTGMGFVKWYESIVVWCSDSVAVIANSSTSWIATQLPNRPANTSHSTLTNITFLILQLMNKSRAHDPVT